LTQSIRQKVVLMDWFSNTLPKRPSVPLSAAVQIPNSVEKLRSTCECESATCEHLPTLTGLSRSC
jgi:hypothetical protein